MDFLFPGSHDKPKTDYFQVIAIACLNQSWKQIWYTADIFILITGLMANAALLWLLFRERRKLSASQILGVNLAVMDLVFLSLMPFSLTSDAQQINQNINTTESETSPTPKAPITEAKDVFSMLNLTGCPLLLACMCIERYLAVVRPILYLRIRRWEYPTAVSAAVWMISLSFCLATGLLKDMVLMMVPVSITISCLFILMLACLRGVVWSLWQQSPALITTGNHAPSVSPLKRRAVGNVLAVVGPAVMVYLPVLVMFPLVLYKFLVNKSLDSVMCTVFELSNLFPKFGVLIGPMFYFSKARQICCPGVKDKK
ncbi:G-protein coupled receptor 183-like [Melanotaenia boesemani]|uniref:G-protein coupled receptor 183-like n=1 Tax=Melanotaenia boesemani TaxID=1250792 RepID=UPI001C04B4DC|nr:G-protein coupled receptor 183-like [Melanotaenia boesemani]